MKAVLVIYNDAIDLEVGEMLAGCGVEHFTKFGSVYGVGAGSGARLGNSVWPGGNNAVLVVTEDAKAPAIVEAVKKLQADIPAEGLRVMWWNMEGMA